MVEVYPDDVRFFVTESNRIEGISRKPTLTELRAHCVFLALDKPTAADLQEFVRIVAPGKPLRAVAGMDVRVGRHIAPRGGPQIPEMLAAILGCAIRDSAPGYHPHRVHVAYETLHPFMDGNGRSGRVLWLWQMLNQMEAWHALRMGFLHLFYYQALEFSNGRHESIATNSPFERVPSCACDAGHGAPPTRLAQLECRMRGGPCSPSFQPGADADSPSEASAGSPATDDLK